MFETMSEQDVLMAAKAKVEERKADDFLVRIFRKESEGAISRGELFVALGGARLEQIAMRETWMPRLIGKGRGGLFEMAIWHVSDKMAQIGHGLLFRADGPQGPPNVAAIDESGWEGPRVLVYPRPLGGTPPAPQEVMRVGAPGDGGNAGNQVRRDVAFSGDGGAAAERAMRAAEDLDRRERAMAEEKHRLELTSMRDGFNRTIEGLSSQLAEIRRERPAVAEASGGIVKTILELAPMAQGLLREWKEVRIAETAAAREAAQTSASILREGMKEQAALFERAQAKSDERFEKMVAELGKNRGGDGSVLKAQTEATGAMANMALTMIHNAKSLLPAPGQGEEKNLVLEVVDKAMPSLEKFFEAMADNATARKLEAQRLAGVPQESKTVSTTATPSAPPPPPARKKDAEAAPSTSITRMVAMVKAFTPPREIAEYFFDTACKTPEMDAALNANERDIAKTLGALAIQHLKPWYMVDPDKASKYLEDVEKMLDAVGIERGQVTPPAAEKAPVETTATEPEPEDKAKVTAIRRDVGPSEPPEVQA